MPRQRTRRSASRSRTRSSGVGGEIESDGGWSHGARGRTQAADRRDARAAAARRRHGCHHGAAIQTVDETPATFCVPTDTFEQQLAGRLRPCRRRPRHRPGAGTRPASQASAEPSCEPRSRLRAEQQRLLAARRSESGGRRPSALRRISMAAHAGVPMPPTSRLHPLRRRAASPTPRSLRHRPWASPCPSASPSRPRPRLRAALPAHRANTGEDAAVRAGVAGQTVGLEPKDVAQGRQDAHSARVEPGAARRRKRAAPRTPAREAAHKAARRRHAPHFDSAAAAPLTAFLPYVPSWPAPEPMMMIPFYDQDTEALRAACVAAPDLHDAAATRGRRQRCRAPRRRSRPRVTQNHRPLGGWATLHVTHNTMTGDIANRPPQI